LDRDQNENGLAAETVETEGWGRLRCFAALRITLLKKVSGFSKKQNLLNDPRI
jgi:hypothetical protein